MARTVLENPPPLTPAKLQDYPYLAWPFPFETLLQAGLLGPRTNQGATPTPHNSAPDPVE